MCVVCQSLRPQSQDCQFLSEAEIEAAARAFNGNNAVLTPDQVADQLTVGYHAWTASIYGTTPGARAFDVSVGGTLTVSLQGLDQDAQTLATAALDTWTAVTGINFMQVSFFQDADITFENTGEGAYAQSYLNVRSGELIISSSVVNVSYDWVFDNDDNPDFPYYTFQTYVHEIGHALGLGHAGNYNGGAEYALDRDYANDSWQMSIMSYFDQTENTLIGTTKAYVSTPMIADILAIQRLYGTATTLRTGNTTYGEGSDAGGVYDLFHENNVGGPNLKPVAMTIVDNGGIDTLNFQSHSGAQRIDLRSGRTSDVLGHTGTLVIALGTVIEQAWGGGGSDTITGNDAANSLGGNGGADTLFGDNGNDTLTGGAGADVLSGGNGFDTLSGGAQNDALFGDGQADALHGDEGNDTLSGGQGFDIVSGGSGNDQLFGGTDEDWMFGGIDDDLVDGGAGGDFVYGGLGHDSLAGGDGNDRLIGEGGNDRLDGGAGNDALTGGDGADVLVGGGGADMLGGGGGADTFVFFATSGLDVIQDFAFAVAGELIDFRAVTGLTFAGLQFADESAGSTLLTYAPGASILLSGVAQGALAADDFLFA